LAELARLNTRRKPADRVAAIAMLPASPYTSAELDAMRAFLNSQLGRRYSIKNYIRGRPYDGIHCAELTSSMLNESGRYHFDDCHKIHPQSLYELVAPTHRRQSLTIPREPDLEPWYARLQRQSTAWTAWCGWCCREAWLFLW
jgi:hypothetical protein